MLLPVNKFQKALAFTYKWEGGTSDHPKDYGGTTKYGITQRTLDTARHYGLVKTIYVRDLTRADSDKIYDRMFWHVCKADEMPHPLSAIVFDTCVMRGSKPAVSMLQRTLNALLGVKLAEDGIFGLRTLQILTKYWDSKARAICIGYIAQREAFHRLRVQIDPSQKVFLGGWLNRNNDLKRYTEEALKNGI